MGNFNRGGNNFSSNRGGGNRFGRERDFGRPSFRNENRGPIAMTQVICDKCKKPCEVPFRPTAGKPVYCNDCFRNQDNFNQSRAPRRDFNDRSQTSGSSFSRNKDESDIKKQLDLLNSKMDKLIISMENLIQAKSSKKTEVVKSIIASLPKKETKKEIKKEIKKKIGKK